MIINMGEGGCDFGWLEDDKGTLISGKKINVTVNPGGRAINQIQVILDTLERGEYKLNYTSDFSYSYNAWGDNPPDHPEFWGIEVIKLNQEMKNAAEIFKTDKRSYQTFRVRDIITNKLDGSILVGIGNKILKYNPDKHLLTDHEINSKAGVDLGLIRSFHQSKDGTIWIGRSNGLVKYNPVENSLRYYQSKKTYYISPDNDFDNLTEDGRGFIWGSSGLFATETSSEVFCFDPQSGKFRRFRHNDQEQNSLSGNNIWAVYCDNTGILWIGTWQSGLNKWNSKKQIFKRYTYDPADPERNNFNTVYSISEDPSGVIWFTTDEGLYSFNRFSNKFSHFKFDPENNDTYALYIEDSSTIWFGADVRGLGKFNHSNGTFKFYSNDPDDPQTISSNSVSCILPDGKNILWLGTGRGIDKFNKSTGEFTRYIHDPKNTKSISSNRVFQIFKDRKGAFWIGTNLGGLNEFNSSDETFSSFQFSNGIKLSTVLPIYEDKKGNFWVGTYRSGLYLFDRKKEISVYNITQKDGLANNLVQSILEDDSGNLWTGTGNGLSKFNPQTHRIKNYYSSENFNGNRFWLNSTCKTSTGDFVFGTYNGFIMFNPDSIKDDPVPPQVVISNVSLFNEPEKQLKINGFIPDLDELDLSYNENDLRFDYVGLHYGDPSKNLYKYKLEGFDKDWIDAGTQRNAVYTNLDAGEYTFRVKACNLDGVWNEEGASLNIIITPPFWATSWAYAFYFLLILGVLYSIRRYELNRAKLANQVKLDEVKLKEREETDRMKSRFFANISHEFRTPLTLIKGPAERISRNSSGEETEKQTDVIKRNADRLLGLINQLLDLSKLEAGKLELKASKQNIVSFVKGITMSFESVAEGKDIALKVIPDKEQIELYFDKEKMTKIMTNLLSNAFKFTPDGGQITVSLNEYDNIIRVKVRDTGIGISNEELPKLFDRFYQVDSSQTREHEGTGIGLALTKELVELHHGTISVDSKLNEGTKFTIELPLGRKHLKDEEIVQAEDPVKVEFIVNKQEFIQPAFEELNETQVTDEDKYIVLVVEDNADVREFIKDSLGSEFQIEEAQNGEQGVRKAEQLIPDLIISDIMMPKMDGNELTRRLKNDEKTSHIPIILLTAKSEHQSRLEGLETGADDYLTKPFDTKELQIRINNLISIRRKLQEKYSRTDFVPVNKSGEKKLSSLEEQFMNKVLEAIENHLSDEEFSIEQFSSEVGMSRVQLHRKLKALSGKSASIYLRSVRLNKAKKMIEEQKGNISEIAYSVGFSSPQYFTRCFKEEFGFPPSDLFH